MHSYTTAYWWCAAFFAFGGVLAAVVFRRRDHGLSLAHARPSAAQVADAPVPEPVGA